MTRLAEGERGAVVPAFALLRPLLLRFCRRLLPEGADVEDTVQATLLKVFARAAQFDTSRDALPWVLAIAAFECRSARKRLARRREVPEEEGAGVADTSPGPEAHLLSGELERALGQVWETLRPEDRETLLAAVGARCSR